ncbi:MAG TPA: ABC transporter ATP-binding protein, partial [Anaerolineae bacterium]|nr:ABC transporter ATP-binding protein [Anaerolineae bacterium]
GRTLGVVGESGCGKSVTMLSVMRLIPNPLLPQTGGRIVDGHVWFEGRDLLTLSEQEMQRVRGHEIAMIFQDPMTSLNPTMRIGQQIAEVLMLHRGLGYEQAMREAVRLLEQVEIPSARERLNDYPYQFSGGMRQRVMIAVALAGSPKLLIADEPTTALDVTIQAQILDLLASLQQELGMAIVLISHNLGVVAGLSDQVAVMYAGKVVESAPADALFAHPVHPYTRALLQAIPSLDASEKTRLANIPGSPPDLINPPPGCRFHPRCEFAVARCRQEEPPLVSTGVDDHWIACWRAEEWQL